MKAVKKTTWPWDAGLRWALFMLALEVGECLALTEVLFSDYSRIGLAQSEGVNWLQIYFVAVLSTLLAQVTGIILVINGYFRAGGVLQIIASTLHVSKIEGLIGVVGGWKALKYESPRAIESVNGSRDDAIESEVESEEPRRAMQGR